MVWPSICGKNGFAVQKNWFEFRLCLFHAEDSTPKRFDLPEQPFWFEKLTKFLNEDGFKNKALLTYEFFRGKKFSSYHQMVLVQNATMIIVSSVDIECKKQYKPKF